MSASQGSGAGRAAGRKENGLRIGMLRGLVPSERVGHRKQCHIACFLTHLKMSVYCAQYCWPSPGCVVFTRWSTGDTHSTHRTLGLFSPPSLRVQGTSVKATGQVIWTSTFLPFSSAPRPLPSLSLLALSSLFFLRAERREGSSLKGPKLSQPQLSTFCSHRIMGIQLTRSKIPTNKLLISSKGFLSFNFLDFQTALLRKLKWIEEYVSVIFKLLIYNTNAFKLLCGETGKKKSWPWIVHVLSVGVLRVFSASALFSDDKRSFAGHAILFPVKNLAVKRHWNYVTWWYRNWWCMSFNVLETKK